MKMKALNNKVMYTLLPDNEQPKRTILNPDGDNLKKAKVISVGSKVEHIKLDDIITLYTHDVRIAEDNIGYCTDTNPIFINNKPQPNKTHIQTKKTNKVSRFNKATVLSSTDKELKEGDEIGYVKGSGLILPDNTEIISDTQIFYKD